jgi:hypothetical protein
VLLETSSSTPRTTWSSNSRVRSERKPPMLDASVTSASVTEVRSSTICITP